MTFSSQIGHNAKKNTTFPLSHCLNNVMLETPTKNTDIVQLEHPPSRCEKQTSLKPNSCKVYQACAQPHALNLSHYSTQVLAYQYIALPETNSNLPLKIGRTCPKRKGVSSNHPFSGPGAFAVSFILRVSFRIGFGLVRGTHTCVRSSKKRHGLRTVLHWGLNFLASLSGRLVGFHPMVTDGLETRTPI